MTVSFLRCKIEVMAVLRIAGYHLEPRSCLATWRDSLDGRTGLASMRKKKGAVSSLMKQRERNL